MKINTARELGALIKDRRRALKLSQFELAARIGVRRLWIVELEKGKPTAQIGLVLRALKALGTPIDISPVTPDQPTDATDLDSIIERTTAMKP